MNYFGGIKPSPKERQESILISDCIHKDCCILEIDNFSLKATLKFMFPIKSAIFQKKTATRGIHFFWYVYTDTYTHIKITFCVAELQVYYKADKYLLFNFKQCTFRMNTTPECESLGKKPHIPVATETE